MLMRTAKITGRSHGWGSLCIVRNVPCRSCASRLSVSDSACKDRLWKYLGLPVSQLINADPQLLWIIIFGWIQWESEWALSGEISGHQFEIDQPMITMP